jgi:hypothetical protein
VWAIYRVVFTSATFVENASAAYGCIVSLPRGQKKADVTEHLSVLGHVGVLTHCLPAVPGCL